MNMTPYRCDRSGLPFNRVLITLCLFAAISSGTSLAATAENDAAIINDAALADESNTSDWLAYGRTYSEQRYSPLTQINDETVSGLDVDWFVELPEAV